MDYNKGYKLGEGSSGCVIRGRIPLSNKLNNTRIYSKNKNMKIKRIEGNYYVIEDRGTVAKLITDKENFKEEVRNILRANKYDKGSSSIQLYGYSILDKNDLKNIKKNIKYYSKITVCKNVNDALNRIDKLYQIIYNDEGIVLNDMHKIYKNIKIKEMIRLCYNLYRGLYYYGINNFSHLDIKDNNIIYLPSKKSMVFIDFGYSKKNTEYDLNIIYNNNYYMIPQIIAYNFIKKHDLKEQDKKDNDYIRKYNENFFPLFKKEYENSIENNQLYLIKYFYNNNEKNYEADLYSMFNYYTSHLKQNTENSKNIIKKDLMNRIKYIDSYKLAFTIIKLFKLYNYNIIESKLCDKYFKLIMSATLINDRKYVNVIIKEYIEFCNDNNIKL